ISAAVQNGSLAPFSLYTPANESYPTPTTTAGFLEPRGNRDHMGLDIQAERGTVIATNVEAQVVYAGYYSSIRRIDDNGDYLESQQDANNKRGFGNLVVLHPVDSDNPQKPSTRLLIYQHLGAKDVDFRNDRALRVDRSHIQGADHEGDGILVAEGQSVSPGTPIGTVGNTGAITSNANSRGQQIGSHLHFGVIEVDPEVNTRMGELRDSDNSKYQEIRKAYFKALGYNNYDADTDQPWGFSTYRTPEERPQKISSFIVLAIQRYPQAYLHRNDKYASYGDFVRGGYFIETMGPGEGLRLDFLKEVPMSIKGEGTEFMDYFFFAIVANLSQEFDKGGTEDLLAFEFCDDPNAFKNNLHEGKRLPINSIKETMIGNIPVLKMGEKQSYILVIPKKYILLYSPGLNLKARNPTASNAYARRVYNLTIEMLKRVSWEQPIDQNSQEFKAWKAHLLALIEEAKTKKES
ncbi:MAG: M23 family metallopeptidase, partial [Elusimicrobia bacterium]|nr:M23 family metallopeptidase [Elusimicrobiota bacterium]